MDSDVLQRLREQNWEEIILRLTRHALVRARRKFWPSGSKDLQTLLSGMSLQDVVSEAITRVFEGKRKWNPIKYPDLLEYLKGVVDSILSDMVRSEENRLMRPRPAMDNKSNNGCVDEDSHVSAGLWNNPSDILSSPDKEAQKKETFELILDLLEGDEDLQLMVIAISEGYTERSEIAQQLGKTTDEVTNMRKRLNRQLDRAMIKGKRSNKL